MSIVIPSKLSHSCQSNAVARAWLGRLPGLIAALTQRWRLRIGEPWAHDDVSAAWVAPVNLADGTEAVLKIGLPHMEGMDEIAGLRFWNGEPTALLLDFDEAVGAMLLERCRPGLSARSLPEPEQDVLVASCLRSMWRHPGDESDFRPLTAMLAYWMSEVQAQKATWPDAALVQEGLQLFRDLPRTADRNVLLATDLHAGNILSAQRKPWLVIDPKPFVGDPAYDGTQHLLNGRTRLRWQAKEIIYRFADLLGVDRYRLAAWLFARVAANTGLPSGERDSSVQLARTLQTLL